MKKRLSTVLLIFVLLSYMILPVNADAAEDVAPTNANQEEAQLFCAAPKDMFPFIYSTHEDWQFWRDYIGECDCEDGYLYVKNEQTGEINQVITEKVLWFQETYAFLYCITESNEIVKATYSGSDVEVLYSADAATLSNLSYYAGKLYFVDGDRLIRFDLLETEYQEITVVEDISSVYAYDVDKLLLTDENGEKYAYDIATDNMTWIESIYEVDELITTPYTESVGDAVGQINTYAMVPIETSISFPLSNYPVGSYFTDNGGPCYDHKTEYCLPNYWDDDECNCKLYGWSAQCMGFARYASDQYAHLAFDEYGSTGWLDARGNCTTEYDAASTDVLENATEVRVAFAHLTKGTYVRLERSDGGHSFVIVRNLDTDGHGEYDSVITYDCNVDGQCGISLNTRTYSDIAENYNYIESIVEHDFSEASTQYSFTYHLNGCSGCSGYVLEGHYTTSAAGNTCDACGYVGNIPVVGW